MLYFTGLHRHQIYVAYCSRQGDRGPFHPLRHAFTLMQGQEFKLNQLIDADIGPSPLNSPGLFRIRSTTAHWVHLTFPFCRLIRTVRVDIATNTMVDGAPVA